MLALPPPFVLQWKRECTADALLSAAQPASEQCIGLMQCSCVLTHSIPPPPPLIFRSPSLHCIFTSLSLTLSVSASHVFCRPSFPHLYQFFPVLLIPRGKISISVGINTFQHLSQKVAQITTTPWLFCCLFFPLFPFLSKGMCQTLM